MPKSRDKKRLVEIVQSLKKGRVLVVGDVMLDQFIYGNVNRISPEAPVPVVVVDRDIFRLGGAANVAANIMALGGNVDLCGVLGDGIWGAQALSLCEEHGFGTKGLITTQRRKTILKTRIIASHQQVVRFDREDINPLPRGTTNRLIEQMEQRLPNCDAVIVSDYGKGVVGKALLDFLRDYRKKRKIPVCVDPVIRNAHYYKGMTLMTPNQHEAGDLLRKKIVNRDEPMVNAGKALMKKLSMESMMITRGEEGMTLLIGNRDVRHIPTRAQQVFDVTGAGDTVIAVFTLSLACGARMGEAAEVANFAAGVVVGKLGTATTDVKELIEAIRRGVP